MMFDDDDMNLDALEMAIELLFGPNAVEMVEMAYEYIDKAQADAYAEGFSDADADSDFDACYDNAYDMGVNEGEARGFSNGYKYAMDTIRNYAPQPSGVYPEFDKKNKEGFLAGRNNAHVEGEDWRKYFYANPNGTNTPNG